MNTQDTTNQESQATPPSTPPPFPTEEYLRAALAQLPAPEPQINDQDRYYLIEPVRRRAELEMVLSAAVAFVVKDDLNNGRLLALGLPFSHKLALVAEYGQKRVRSLKAQARLDEAVAAAVFAEHEYDRVMEKHLRHFDRSWSEDFHWTALRLNIAIQKLSEAISGLGRDFGYFDSSIYPAMRALANRIHEIKEFPDLRVQPSPTTPVTGPTADQAGHLVPASTEFSTITAGSDKPPTLNLDPGVGYGSTTRISTASR